MLRFVIALLLVYSVASATERPNVLMICVDDLRPELGCYGASYMKTPNLDSFAATARLFRRHYVQVPTCGASRYSMLTSQYPREPLTHGNDAFRLLRERGSDAPDAPVTLPQHLRNHGYYTVSLGKISHQPDGRMRAEGKPTIDLPEPEMPGSWDEVGLDAGKWGDAWSAFFGYADGSGRERGKSKPYEAAEVDDRGYPDGIMADQAIAKLRELKDRQFFLAVGFYKPHLPFNAPRKYWDMYDPMEIPLAPWREAPRGIDPKVSMHGSGEFFGNYGQHPQDARQSDEYLRHIRHAYAASVSYIDAQIGRVLDEVRRLELDRNTIVVIWGDHGWHIGDHGLFGKHTPYERSLNSVLIVQIPGMKRLGATDAIVESADIFPTLTEMCGLPTPPSLDGRSFAATLRDPGAPTDNAALGFWRNGKNFAKTVRTDRHRLIRWTAGLEPDADVVQVELYDHRSDPNETQNIAAEHPDVVQRLTEQMLKSVKAAQ